MSFPKISLPIDAFLPGIVQHLEKERELVLQASPGSGKTTRVPPALLRATFVSTSSEILVLEPRRLAAKYAARRVSDELGESVGGTVGYQFRFEKVSGPKTRLRYLTEGMLMRRLIGDPQLNNVSVVILDEFHERHLHTDLALAQVRRLQKGPRADLRLVIMSATLDTGTIAAYLGGTVPLRIDAPRFPVDIEYQERPSTKSLEQQVKDAAIRCAEQDGDTLVFLPGMAEIRRCEDALDSFRRKGILVLPLHGELSREEQDRALLPGPTKKILLSTNVAETSLTIEGIRHVVDSGLHRQASYSWWSGVPALRTRPIAKASAEQRAGRAGRTSAGRCLRLYTKAEFDGRPSFDTPEIQRADMAQTVLELKVMGVTDLATFPWLESPSPAALESACQLLFRLGALKSPAIDSQTTALAERLLDLPTHPRLARLLLEAEKRGVLEDAATLAAGLSEGGLQSLDALEGLKPYPRHLERHRRQLLGAFPSKASHSDNDALAYSVLTGFPDRVARKRTDEALSRRVKSHQTELIFSSGGSALVEDSAFIRAGDTFVTLDIQESQARGQVRSRLHVRSLCRIEPEWLFDLQPSAVKDEEALTWNREKERVECVSRLTYDQVVLEETRGKPTNPAAVSALLLREGLGLDPSAPLTPHEWLERFARLHDKEALESALARALLAGKHGLKALAWDELRGRIVEECQTASSLQELRSIHWATRLGELALGSDAHRLEHWLPSGITLPGGRRIQVHYRLDRPPWIESRLQDFFGMRQSPTLVDGRVPLTLHLLAPNQRAVQVTTDLEGFWDRAYPEIRKELSRKYPRHSWPDNPRTAAPPKPKPKR